MREHWQELTGRPQPETPLDQAQLILQQAFGTSDRRKRVALARKALEVSPDCVDAYVLLAEEAASRKEALEFYRQGVEAGERILGPDRLENEREEFWLDLDTRPYMRARFGLAHVLWALGRRDEAIAHLEAMLRLNPNDNQGVRYILSGWLLNMDRFDDLVRLLDSYDEATAVWAYTRALLAFRQEGDSPGARKQLKAAQRLNKHVPAYLLGTKPMPHQPPPYYGLGDENEAIHYAAMALGGWKATPGATNWLRELTQKPKRSTSRKSKNQGPTPLVLKRLLALPQAFDNWQADFQPLPTRVRIEGEWHQPLVGVVLSSSAGLVLAQAVFENAPSADELWNGLIQAMDAPMAGEPHRPTTIQVRAVEPWDTLKPHLQELGIEVETVERCDDVEELLRQFSEDLTGDQPPGLLEVPGVNREQVAGFYRAAAEFYRRAPWRKLGFESAIRVDCDRLDSGPRYAVIMGQSGLTFGLALYDDLRVLRKLWASRMSDEENARETVALTVTYEESANLPDADLDAIEQFGWEIAGPEAYPSIFRKERGLSMRPPLGWELELMQSCLYLIPDFVDRYPPDDPTKLEATVEVPSGPLRLTLAWVED